MRVLPVARQLHYPPPQNSSRTVPAKLTHISCNLCVDKLLDRFVALWQNTISLITLIGRSVRQVAGTGALKRDHVDTSRIATPFARFSYDTDIIFSFRCNHEMVWTLVTTSAGCCPGWQFSG